MSKYRSRVSKVFRPIGQFLHRYRNWLLAGLIVRLLLMPFTLHVDPTFIGDIVAMNRHAYLIAFDSESTMRAWPSYPLPAYYTMAFFQMVLSPLSPSIPLDISGQAALTNWVNSPMVFRQLFFFKLWYLLFDVGAAFFLWRIVQHDQSKARRAVLLWWLNPIVIYNAYFHGQFDLVPVFFTVLAFYVATREHPTWSLLLFVVAAGYKVYPLFFVLPALLVLYRSWRERLKVLLLGGAGFLVFILPRLIDYNNTASFYADRFFGVSYDIRFGGQVYVFFALYAALMWYVWSIGARGSEALWRVCLITLLIYYPFSYFDLHYWAWIIPFVILYWVNWPEEALPSFIAMFVFLLVLTVLAAPIPVNRFLAPISPDFFLRLPGLLEILRPYIPVFLLTNTVRSVLVGTSFYLAWRVLRQLPSPRIGSGGAALDVSRRE
jgi:hypothetical protein